jgi:N-methylhydantoinase A
MRLLGVDTGGTFTDFVLLEDGRLSVHKLSSTPAAPEQAILAGVAALGGPRDLTVVHGSTVATNALLEGKGARTAYITNQGLGDVLSIGRQARRALYDLAPPPVPPPVPPELVFEVGGRLAADGRVIEPVSASELERLRRALHDTAPEAVAINLLFAFRDGRHEREVAAAVPDDAFLALSHEVLPEYREYERGIATWLAAYLGPRVSGYLARLSAGLPGVPVAVMQSSGSTVGAAEAARRAVHLLLSGPAGGLNGAQLVASRGGQPRLLSFDMGGTSTDVALLDGPLILTTEGRVGPYPVAVPMVDMHTIGAGGGSIARVDAGGLLRVGPESAGAQPGPACYGRGGREATVTDANLVLGRIVPEAFMGGTVALDVDAAHAAVARIATALGLSLEAAAAGIVRVADAHMVGALRVMSVQRGRDPRDYTLTSFGGAGGLHVCALAEALGMTRALVPAHAGVLSALGMLAAPRGREFTRTVLGADPRAASIEQGLALLEAEGRAALSAEQGGEFSARRLVELRYRGQAYTLTLEWQGKDATEDAFHRAHHARYGHALAVPIEVVNIRIGLHAPAPDLPSLSVPAVSARVPRQHRVAGCVGPVPVVDRASLAGGGSLVGPALVVEAHATTWLAPGWAAASDAAGNLLLTRRT